MSPKQQRTQPWTARQYLDAILDHCSPELRAHVNESMILDVGLSLGGGGLPVEEFIECVDGRVLIDRAVDAGLSEAFLVASILVSIDSGLASSGPALAQRLKDGETLPDLAGNHRVVEHRTKELYRHRQLEQEWRRIVGDSLGGGLNSVVDKLHGRAKYESQETAKVQYSEPLLLVRNIGRLVTLSGQNSRRGYAQADLNTLENCLVIIRGGLIEYIGSAREADRFSKDNPAARVIDARQCLVTPGLIDPHTHLVFAGSRVNEFEMRALGKTYSEIMAAGGGIHATVAATRAVSEETLQGLAMKHIRRMWDTGTTTLEIKSGYGLDIEVEKRQIAVADRCNDRTVTDDVLATYMGAHAIPAGMSAEAYVDFVCNEAIPAVAKQGIARFCDVFCEAGVFTPEQSERILLTGKQYGLIPKIHADELTDTGGAALAARVGAISADHLHCANDDGLRAMAEAGTIAVLLPGTAVYLGLPHHAPARKMIELGVPVAIGTDFNPGSCMATSLPLMMTFACAHLGMTPAEALTAVTINAAYAIGMGEKIGSIEVGKQADLVIWDTDDYRQIPYQMGHNLVKTVIKRGHII